MPDLSTHFAFAVLPSVFFKRFRNLFFFFAFGAILPDIPPAFYVAMDYGFNLFNFDPTFAIWYMQPWHTPLGGMLLGVVAFLLFGNKVNDLLAIFAGIISHFILDSIQKRIGISLLLGYPFYFKDLFDGLLFSDHILFLVFSIISTLFLIFVLLTFKLPVVRLRISFFRLIGILFFLTIIFILPFFTKEFFYKSDFHYLNFFKDPSSYEGKNVAICVAEVISINPWKIKELNHVIEFVPPPQYINRINIKDNISFKGLYKDNRIYVNFLYLHKRYRFKVLFSLVGLVLFVIFFIFNYQKEAEL